VHYHSLVSEPNDSIVVDPSGAVRTSSPSVTKRLRECAGEYHLAVSGAGMLVLRNAQVNAGARVLMAGEIINRMTMMEIINIIATANFRGELHVIGTGPARMLAFDQGALKHAKSDAIHDRLGEVMFRTGALSRADLESVLADPSGNRRFGERCVERGLIDSKKLFEQLQRQAEQIFFSALLVGDGHYLFLLPDEKTSEPYPATVHVPIQGLLMEGVQRIDEMALFRDKVPDSSVRPRPVPEAKERKIDDTARKVFGLCDGERTLDQIARETGLGEFLTTKGVYHLLQAGMVTLKSGPKVDPESVKRLVTRFNEVLQDVFVAVATYGGLAQTRATLEAWIVGSGYDAYFGPGVDDFGAIDASRVARAIKDIDHERPIEGLHQALHELAAFALFSATTGLPRDQELSLARDVNARLKAIRID
jgi:hypothetical protein